MKQVGPLRPQGSLDPRDLPLGLRDQPAAQDLVGIGRVGLRATGRQEAGAMLGYPSGREPPEGADGEGARSRIWPRIGPVERQEQLIRLAGFRYARGLIG